MCIRDRNVTIDINSRTNIYSIFNHIPPIRPFRHILCYYCNWNIRFSSDRIAILVQIRDFCQSFIRTCPCSYPTQGKEQAHAEHAKELAYFFPISNHLSVPLGTYNVDFVGNPNEKEDMSSFHYNHYKPTPIGKQGYFLRIWRQAEETSIQNLDFSAAFPNAFRVFPSSR